VAIEISIVQLIEIKEKVRNTKIPKVIYDELWVFEVDSLNSDSPQGLRHLVDEMQRSVAFSKGYRVPLSKASQDYLLREAVPNLINIANTNQDAVLTKSLQRFQAHLHSKLLGADSVMENWTRDETAPWNKSIWVNHDGDKLAVGVSTEYGKVKNSRLRDPAKTKWMILVTINGHEILYKGLSRAESDDAAVRKKKLALTVIRKIQKQYDVDISAAFGALGH
jgi:hypothetical protein